VEDASPEQLAALAALLQAKGIQIPGTETVDA